MRANQEKLRTRLTPEKRKEQLLACALDIFAKRGLSRAGHAEIAESAQVSVATVFNYFPSREALVDHVLSHVRQTFAQHIHSVNTKKITPKAKLIAISELQINAALNQENWLKIWYEWSTTASNENGFDFVKARNALLRQYSLVFEAMLNIESDPAKQLALLFDGLNYVIYLHCQQQPDQATLTTLASQLVDHLCQSASD